MLVSARNSFLVGHRRWKNPYCTDGLIAYWDGIWNAGGGVHDANATKWTDLTGNGYDWNLSQYGSFGSTALVSASGAAAQYAATASRMPDSYAAVSIVCSTSAINTSRIGLLFVLADKYGFGLAARDGGTVYAGNNVANGQSSKIGSIYGATAMTLNRDGSGIIGLWRDGAAKTLTLSKSSGYMGNVYRVLGADKFGSWWKGCIYRLSLYARARTAAEVAADYAVDVARFNLRGGNA